MSMQFRLPDLGEGVKEGQIIKVLVQPGDTVREDQPLMEVETDKAAVEIPCPYNATVSEIHIAEGQVVNVGDVMMTFESAAAASGAATGQARRSAAGKRASATPRAATAAADSPDGPSDSSAAVAAGKRISASPAVRKLAREMKVDLASITGSGPGGRITREDVERAAKGVAHEATDRVSKAPSASADGGAAPVPAGEIPDGEADEDQYGPIVRHSLSQARKTIAANMTASWTTIPHVTDSDDADVTELERLRKGYPSDENNNRKVTTLAFVIRAVARALRIHPVFNAHFDADKQQIIYRRYINIAIGVHTRRGLVAPLIRNTDQLGVVQIADELAAQTEMARTASFSIEDTRGGTYTISNAGAFGGSRYSTPIVTPGQCAVLAIGRTRAMPWVVDGEITKRLIMPLSHSFDHRIADGGEEIAFLRCVIDALENPARLLL